MWTLKYDGNTVYVHHVNFEDVSFTTKETPDNPSTKGSLKFRNVDLTLDDGTATIAQKEKQ